MSVPEVSIWIMIGREFRVWCEYLMSISTLIFIMIWLWFILEIGGMVKMWMWSPSLMMEVFWQKVILNRVSLIVVMINIMMNNLVVNWSMHC